MSSEQVSGYKVGKIIIEGKTKKVYEVDCQPSDVIVVSKDRITAGDGIKSHELKGKAAISTSTNAKVFELLNKVGLKTSYIKQVADKAFLARKCEMLPIEWVTRRVATGSFVKRYQIEEGFKFYPPLQETFFKDDANHDPQWIEEQIIAANFVLNGVKITRHEIDIMRKTAATVFEVLEKAWASRNCALIDMKIEFGVDCNGEILVSDIIDSDSWRLWPSGDKRLMKDKQVYRDLSEVTAADLDKIKSNFEWISNQLDHFCKVSDGLAVVLMGSPSDEEHARKIEKSCQMIGVPCDVRVTSAHKGTEETLKIAAEYEGSGRDVVFIAVAGRSNGLGPVLSGNTSAPVINCPPVDNANVSVDIWSSLRTPSGLSCTTVIFPETAALAAAQILAMKNHVLWGALRVKNLSNYVALKKADQRMRNKTL